MAQYRIKTTGNGKHVCFGRYAPRGQQAYGFRSLPVDVAHLKEAMGEVATGVKGCRPQAQKNNAGLQELTVPKRGK